MREGRPDAAVVCAIAFVRQRPAATDQAAVQNLFNLGRHLVRAQHYREFRIRAFSEWNRAVA